MNNSSAARGAPDSSGRPGDLHGVVALVPAASQGLGLAVATELARRGCAVAICARDAGG